ncbi:MAG: hypothetical protein ACE5HF_08095 [Gemmatimonadota bacterium]
MRPLRARPPGPGRGTAVALALALALGAAGGCREKAALTLPRPDDLEGLYGSGAEVTLNGNVVDVHVVQDARQLRRGGNLWAKVGPYIYLFSPQTRDLFAGYTGVGGVRVRTFDPQGRLVAEALLERGALNGFTWNKALNLVGKARLEGSRRPGYMENLVRYGEDLAEHEYSPRYVKEEG